MHLKLFIHIYSFWHRWKEKEEKTNIATPLTCGQQRSSSYIAHQRRPNAIKRSRNHAFGGVGAALTPRVAGKVTWWCTVPSSPSNEAINSTQSPHHSAPHHHHHSPTQRPKLPQTVGDRQQQAAGLLLLLLLPLRTHRDPSRLPVQRRISSSSAPA